MSNLFIWSKLTTSSIVNYHPTSLIKTALLDYYFCLVVHAIWRSNEAVFLHVRYKGLRYLSEPLNYSILCWLDVALSTLG